MGRGNVGRAKVGAGCGARDGLIWWGHHVSHGVGLDQRSVGDSGSTLLVTSARVGVVVDARVPGELVGAAEAL